MKMKSLPKLIVLGFISLTTIIGCKKETDKPISKQEPKVSSVYSINFKPLFNNEDLKFNEMKWITSSGDTLNFARIRMILSNIKLVKDNGEELALDTFAFISLDQNRKSIGFEELIPAGDYKGIKFDIGLDSNINHGDPEQWGSGHPLNPLVNQMHWTWATGYIFMVVEGHFMKNSDPNAIFSFHMANMFYKKSISIEKSGGFKVEGGQTGELNIAMHLDKYFNSPNPLSFKNEGSTSHSNSVSERLIMDKLHGNLSQVFEIK
jgi:hypothetical protein